MTLLNYKWKKRELNEIFEPFPKDCDVITVLNINQIIYTNSLFL